MNKPINNIIAPIPAREPIIGAADKVMNQPWELWFRKLSDVVRNMSESWNGSNIIGVERIEVPGFHYTIDGNRYFFNYNGPGDITISLPYPALYTTPRIQAGSTKLYISAQPSTGTNVINDWFFISVS